MFMQYIKRKVYDDIVHTIGKAPIESGGIIGEKDGIICEYFFDKSDVHKDCRYIPNLNKLNAIINAWNKRGVSFIGFVHSHPNMYNKPSTGDAEYAQKLFLYNKNLKRLVFPIVTFSSDEGISISFYEYIEAFKEIGVTII